jgi:hypothetical protein
MRGLMVLAVLGMATFSAGSADEAAALVDRAIAARGGLEQVRKLRRMEISYTGSVVMNGRHQAFRTTVWQDLPDRLRTTFLLQTPERALEITQILAGGSGWRIQADGAVTDLSKAEILALQMESHPGWLACLYPLKEPGLTLTVLPDQRVDGADCAVLKVETKDRPSVELYFDKSTWLLARWTCPVRVPHVGTQQEDVRLDRYELRAGIPFPLRLASFRDRNLFMEAHLSQVRLVHEFDPALFARPQGKE